MPTSSRRCPVVLAVALVALLAALLLGACGTSSDAAGPTSGGAGTVTIKHHYGSTTVAVHPKRIVSLDTQWTDVLLAMGDKPVGYIADPNAKGAFPWQGDRLAGSTALKATTVLPYEQVAALHPDLIVVTYLAQSSSDYKKLSDIAPTIPLLGDKQVDSWQEIATTAGKVLGEPAKAQQLVSGVNAKVAAVAQQLPGLQGKTFALANYIPGQSINVVADPKDGSNVLFTQLGLKLPQKLIDAGRGHAGRVEVSLERLDLLDTNLLVLFTNGLDPKQIPGYENLPAVKSGAALVLDYADVVGINTPTPLSIPYELKLLRPALEHAAASA